MISFFNKLFFGFVGIFLFICFLGAFEYCLNFWGGGLLEDELKEKEFLLTAKLVWGLEVNLTEVAG